MAGQLLLAVTSGILITRHLTVGYSTSIIAGQLLLAVTSGIPITRHLTVGYHGAINQIHMAGGRDDLTTRVHFVDVLISGRRRAYCSRLLVCLMVV
ncbi:hypothetical protein DPMN_120614 [Dreissena polymorpha]|uniref:Uncharacterized protein n=1 Tax=Dreissena polymorpha TaxID=45954 RepID=A0A9D4JSV1_DREPO|nr:hypothetical protein DPMN_120614 [Dreissena polymorpha]